MGVKFVFTTEHVEIVQNLIKRLTCPDVLAFPDFKAALSGKRPFRLITDASVDGLGEVIEQAQTDSSTRPLYFRSRTTLPNERNWSCLLYTSPSPRDKRQSRMPSSA